MGLLSGRKPDADFLEYESFEDVSDDSDNSDSEESNESGSDEESKQRDSQAGRAQVMVAGETTSTNERTAEPLIHTLKGSRKGSRGP